MRSKRLLAVFLVLAALLALCPASVYARAAATDDAWWEKDYWEEERLIELGAELPVYNAATKQYEISTPGQILYLSGIFKKSDSNGDGAPDAPCDGVYVLTADVDMAGLMADIGEKLSKLAGRKIEGYMPPIATETAETAEEGVKCAFFGTFDGQGHTISNIRLVRMGSKYAGFFGNVGHDFGEGFVRNLALINIRLECTASCGLLAGGLYGDVDNCVVIGSIDCREKTAGGLAGKIKKNDNGYLGTVRNCFVYADITVHGEGSENGAAGGMTSSQSDGGRIYDSYVGGSLTVLGSRKAEAVGGISGSINGGQAIENTVMLLSSINVESGINIGLLAGDYSGETGSHLTNNYVWEGTAFSGHVADSHPETAAFATVDASALLSRAFYADTLSWDFDAGWGWVGEDGRGFPMPLPFAGIDAVTQGLIDRIAGDLIVQEPILRPSEPMASYGYAGEPIRISASLTLPEGMAAEKVGMHYGTEKDGSAYTQLIPLQPEAGGVFSELFVEADEGVWYYYLEATVDGKVITFPNDISECLRLQVDSASVKCVPQRITISPGERYDTVGMSFITAEDGLHAKLRYRVAGADSFTELAVEDIRTVDAAGRGTFTGYSVDITGLLPATQYEYEAVATKDGAEYVSEPGTFTTLTDNDAFSFLVVSDLQSTNEEGYLPFLHTMNGFVGETLGGADFVVNLGDLTEGCSLPEWAYMFNTLGEYFANSLNAFVPGNHESKGGDSTYSIFKAQVNQPGGLDDPYIGESTGSFVAGDVCFVILNTEPYSGLDGADTAADKIAFYEAQKAWAKQAFEASGCTWRIIAAHAGLIQDDETATAFLEKMCDELDVDLYFNGHIHNYYRAAVRDGSAAQTGAGTTFITTSPMGRKFDDFISGEIDDLLQFQTGGSYDERQYFTEVKVDASGLTVTAYQRTNEGDDTKKATFAEFTVIDSIQLSASLSSLHAPPPQAAEAAEATPPPEPPQAAPADDNTLWYLLAGVLIAAAAAAVVTVRRKKKKAAEG